MLDCIEDRLLAHRYEAMCGHGGGFQIGMAGGGAALLTARDSDSCIGQFVDAYGVHPYDLAIIRVHLHCGKLAGLTKPGGELYGMFDPTNVADLYRLGDTGADLIRKAIIDAHGVDVPIRVEVIDVIYDPDGLPAGNLLPRPTD
jgi:hypothetical protein